MDGLLRATLALRFLMLVGAAGALAGSLVMYAAGFKYVGQALGLVGGTDHQPVVLVLEAMDAFLFGIVLTIFAYGITFGFVVKLDAAWKERLPDWMDVTGIHQLKHTLAEVVLVVLIVSFAKEVVEADEKLDWTAIVIPASVLLLAGALKLLRHDGSH